MKNLVVAALALLFCVVASSTFALPKPADWSESDWEKFIEEGVQIGLSGALDKVGSATPAVDVYAALSAFGASTNVGLRLWLNRKMAETEDQDKINRYQAYFTCLGGDCSRLHALTAAEAFEANTNRPGSDYRVFDLPSANPQLCQQQCISESGCRAWTYVRPNSVQGPHPRCWLKNSIPSRKTADCCVSGVTQH
jgi:hypothetical protein